MKLKRKITILVILLILILIGIAHSSKTKTITPILTGDILTGEITWIIVEPPKEITIDDITGDVDRFNFLMSWENKVSVQIDEQPQQSAGEYKANSYLLIQRMKSHLQTFQAPSDIKGGYFYIKIRQPLKLIGDWKNYQSITLSTNLRNKGWRIYGRLIVAEAIKISDTEYLFPLNKVVVNNSKWDNRIPLLKWQTLYMWGFVGAFDWNWIEEITMVWYK